MPSRSRQDWADVRARSLNGLLAAHRSLGGTGRGRRFATQQVNYAYAVLLSSQFQGFCRDLHSESVEYLTQGIHPVALRSSCSDAYKRSRRLDHGNPNPGNIGADFDALGLTFWPKVLSLSPRNKIRRDRLEELNQWRNAIAHQDFSRFRTGPRLRLGRVEAWRKACNQLTRAFDEVMRVHIGNITGSHPW